MSFESDIQGKNTQLFPVVEIGGIWYSTNNVTVDGNYCKPILMNIPSIKESVDVESKKFKTSNVSLQFNNFSFDGIRLSDQLSQIPMINTDATIYFKSPSTTTINTDVDTDLFEVYKGIIRKITHDDIKVTISLEDYTEKKTHKNLPQTLLGDGDDVPDKYKNQPVPMIYGHIERSPLVISSNFNKYQADARQVKNFVDMGSGYNNISDNEIKLDSLQVDIDGELLHIKRENQWASYDNHINLFQSVDVEAEGTSLICRQIPKPKFSINNIKYDSELANEDFLDGTQYSIDNINAITDGSLDDNPIGLLGKRDWSFNNIAYQTGRESLLLTLRLDVHPQHDTVDGNNKIIGFRINGYNLPKLLGYQVLKAVHHENLDGDEGDTVSHNLTSAKYNESGGYNLIWSDDCPHADVIENVFGFTYVGSTAEGGTSAHNYPTYGVHYDYGESADIKLNYYDELQWADPTDNTMDMPLILFRGGENNSLNIEFRVVGSFTPNSTQTLYKPRVEVTGNINEIGLLVENQATKLFNNDFYANVQGRINEFDDHPDSSLVFQTYSNDELVVYLRDNWDEIIATLDPDLGHDDNTLNNILNGIIAYLADTSVPLSETLLNDILQIFGLVDNEIIQNPIDIIYDLVRSEIGHDVIDEAEYLEAKKQHFQWKFDFTLNKRINSKSLIQQIAESTKCFPKFKSDGTFGFNTIKDSYTVVDDYDTAYLIKALDIISYSFNKTKSGQIYKKIDVQYHKDYVEDSLLKRTDAIDLGADDYYGIESSSDAYLEFESDYIRHENTALALRDFLVEQYKNDHLTFKLKLPLQYIKLEVGSLVKFEDLIGGIKAYGIDYRKIQAPNNQIYYPLFMVTSTKKSLDSVSIECMQLHHLAGYYDLDWESDLFAVWTGTEDVNVGMGAIYSSDALGVTPPVVTCTVNDVPLNVTTPLLATLTTPYLVSAGALGIVYSPPGQYNQVHTAIDEFGDTYATIQNISINEAVQPDTDEAPVADLIIPHGDYSMGHNHIDLANDSEGGSLYDHLGDLPFDYTLYPEIISVGAFIKIKDFSQNESVFIITSLVSGRIYIDYFTYISGDFISNVSQLSDFGDLEITKVNPIDVGIMGDVNLDYTVSILDLVTLVNYILTIGMGGTGGITEGGLLFADLNEDNDINILDVVTMVNYILAN